MFTNVRLEIKKIDNWIMKSVSGFVELGSKDLCHGWVTLLPSLGFWTSGFVGCALRSTGGKQCIGFRNYGIIP